MTSVLPDLFSKLVQGCHGDLRLLVSYGSGAESDDDYLAVFEELPRTSSLTAGALDLWAITEAGLEEYTKLLDPFVSEPLLTGKIVYGPGELFERYQSKLAGQPVSVRIIRHLLCRSTELYLVACQRLEHGTDDSPVLNREFWSGLSFSVSYWAYAKCYSMCYHGPMALSAVISASPICIQELWREINSRKTVGSHRQEDLLSKWEAIMLAIPVSE